MNKKLIVANWKMSPESLAEAEQILEFTDEYLSTLEDKKEFSLIFCPPFVFTEEVAKILKTSHLEHDAELGAQDIFWEDAGSDTGEVSGTMLRKLGVKYVIIGHSERRWKLGESDEVVNKKLKAVLRNEMIPIVCIGEITRDDDFSAKGAAPAGGQGSASGRKKFLEKQVLATFKDLSADEIGKCIIAYEPVWAISSNPGAKPDTPESALESIKVIENTITENWKLKIENLPKALYGGSVNSKNISSFLGQDEIYGVLIGSASVNKEEFVKILEIITKPI